MLLPMLLVAKGIATRSKDAGLTTRNEKLVATGASLLCRVFAMLCI